jgi:hypothetical protein
MPLEDGYYGASCPNEKQVLDNLVVPKFRLAHNERGLPLREASGSASGNNYCIVTPP